MAVLPTYTDNGTLNSGGDTLRLNRKEDSGGAAMAHFGATLGGYAVAEANADAKIAGKADAEQKKTDALSDALVLEDMQTQWHKKQADLEANIDPAGQGHFDNIQQAWNEHVGEYADKWSQGRARENQVLVAKMGRGVLNRAVDIEKETVYKSQLALGNQIITDAGKTVSANPDLFDSVLEDARLRADTFQGRAKEPFLQNVRRAAELGRADAYVMSNPRYALDAANGAVAGLAQKDAPPEQAKVIQAAKATDMDPAVLLGIGHIETGGKFDPNLVSKNGFEGVFQTKGESSAYGPHDAKDTFAQGVATGNFLAARQQEMRERGIEPTPGNTFMFHNLGEGVAWRLLQERDPTKTMGQLLYDVYGDSKFANGQLKRDAVGRANPSLYNPNMTVQEVRSSYETAMRSAMGATSGLVSETAAPDAKAREAMSQMLGIPVEQLNAADLANIATNAAKAIGTQTKADQKLQLGAAIFNGDVRMQPFNSDHKAAVDAIVKEHFPEVADQLVQDDPAYPGEHKPNQAAFAQVGRFVQQHSYLPHQWRDAVREVIMNGNPKDPKKAYAYSLLVDMQKNNPTAYEASGIDGDVTKRVDLYARAMERTSNAGQALQFIDQEFSQEHKEQRQALKAVVDSNNKQHPGEVQRLSLTDITGMFKKDNNIWRAPIEPENSAQEELLMNAYREIYKQYRYTDHSAEASKDLALSDLKRSWGISNAFVGPTQPARFMQNPPDRFYGQPILGMKPFEEQAREVVGQELARRYPSEAKTLKQYGDISGDLSGYDASKIEVHIFPARTTNDDVRSGSSSPRYQVAYRDPRTGFATIADTNWQPNKDRMEQEEKEAMIAQKAAADRKRKVLNTVSESLANPASAGPAAYVP